MIEINVAKELEDKLGFKSMHPTEQLKLEAWRLVRSLPLVSPGDIRGQINKFVLPGHLPAGRIFSMVLKRPFHEKEIYAFICMLLVHPKTGEERYKIKLDHNITYLFEVHLSSGKKVIYYLSFVNDWELEVYDNFSLMFTKGTHFLYIQM